MCIPCCSSNSSLTSARWNSCDWLEFSREWNIPVHHFFRRHVYSASRGHLSRPAATVITFFISALAHELIMGCITKKLRGYGFFAMMLQMPIVMVQRSKWVRGRTLLNNVLFWCSMILGLSMVRFPPPPLVCLNRGWALTWIDVCALCACLVLWSLPSMFFQRLEHSDFRMIPDFQIITIDVLFLRYRVIFPISFLPFVLSPSLQNDNI